jgi:hypothetical protein
LESQGYQVLRIWNHDALYNADGVWVTIHALASKTSARARMERWRLQNSALALPSMGRAAPEAPGGVSPSSAHFETREGSPPPAAMRLASPIEGEAGAKIDRCAP